jgi:hypothetical protein
MYLGYTFQPRLIESGGAPLTLELLASIATPPGFDPFDPFRRLRAAIARLFTRH